MRPILFTLAMHSYNVFRLSCDQSSKADICGPKYSDSLVTQFNFQGIALIDSAAPLHNRQRLWCHFTIQAMKHVLFSYSISLSLVI